MSLQMTRIQIGQEWPIWGWKLVFPALPSNVFSRHGGTTSDKTYSQTQEMNQPLQPLISAIRQDLKYCRMLCDSWHSHKKKIIPKLVLGKQATLSFFGYEKSPFFQGSCIPVSHHTLSCQCSQCPLCPRRLWEKLQSHQVLFFLPVEARERQELR